MNLPYRPLVNRRYLEVMHLSAQGLTIHQIAVRLGVPVATINHRRTTLYRDLGVTCMIEAIAACAEIKWHPEYELKENAPKEE